MTVWHPLNEVVQPAFARLFRVLGSLAGYSLSKISSFRKTYSLGHQTPRRTLIFR